jgi:Succinylglutamate desuccinylase / Aspartoacylase family
MTKIFSKILVIGGIHGNEPLGIQLVKLINILKIPNLDAIMGNPFAIDNNIRYVEQDLNRVFNLPEENSLEKNRAIEILNFIEKGDYDLILDFHNTTSSNNNCYFVGKKYDQILLDVSEFLGLNNVIIADYNCVNNYAKRCVSIEISSDSNLNNSAYWLNKILNLLDQETIPEATSINKFKCIQKIRKKEEKLLNFSWNSFTKISDLDKQKLFLNEELDYFSIFINEDAYLPDYYALLIIKMP